MEPCTYPCPRCEFPVRLAEVYVDGEMRTAIVCDAEMLILDYLED